MTPPCEEPGDGARDSRDSKGIEGGDKPHVDKAVTECSAGFAADAVTRAVCSRVPNGAVHLVCRVSQRQSADETQQEDRGLRRATEHDPGIPGAGRSESEARHFVSGTSGAGCLAWAGVPE